MIHYIEFNPSNPTTFIDLSLNEIPRDQVLPHAPMMSLNACTVSYSLYRLKHEGATNNTTVHFSFCRDSDIEDSNVEQLIIQTTVTDAEASVNSVSRSRQPPYNRQSNQI